MKKILFTIIAAFIAIVNATILSAQDIEIVESIPIETSLDNSDIRNTKEVWLEMIEKTKHSLDIEQFYISDEPGKSLEDVLNAICKTADRGVKVRIIVDARMYKTYPVSVDSLGHRKNIETRKINFGKIAGGIQHSKYFIVDNEEVFVGSQNFDWRALEHIHELGLRIRNSEIASVYKDVFELDWKYASDALIDKQTPLTSYKKYRVPVRIAVSAEDTATISPTISPLGFIPDSTLWDETAIVRLIDGANQTLALQFLSYSLSEQKDSRYTVVDNAIRRAAKRGVKVQMIVSDWAKGSSAIKALKELSTLPNIEVAFTIIPEWSGGYISFARVEHCKYIVADKKTFWLGTSNCSKDYFYSSRNLGIVGESNSISKTLTRIFHKSWTSPYKELITKDGEYQQRFHGEK